MARTGRVPPVWLVSEEDRTQPTQSRSVGPSISDAVGAHRFPTDWRLTVRRVGREKRVSLMPSRDGAVGSTATSQVIQSSVSPLRPSQQTLAGILRRAPSCQKLLLMAGCKVGNRDETHRHPLATSCLNTVSISV